MTAKLAARLEKEPDNVDGWVMLARTYYQQRKFPQAARAYEKLTVLLPNEADLYADYADVLAMAQGRQLSGKPMDLVKKALELDPKHWKALAMAGTEAFDRKDYKAAITYWERLKANAGDQPIGKQIQASIDEARQLAGLPPSAPTAPVAPAAATTSKAVPAQAAKADAPAAAGAKGVFGTVTLNRAASSMNAPGRQTRRMISRNGFAWACRESLSNSSPTY